MCLTYSSQDHLQVMSSGDTAVVPSSTPNSDSNKLPLSNETKVEQDNINSSSLLHPDRIKKVNSRSICSDSKLQDQSMMPANNSSSDSLENRAPNIREVTSLEAEDVGERESAFEITSFRPAHMDDLDKSGAGRPMSTDSLTLHTVPEKGESQESVTTPTNTKQQVTNTQPESSLQKHTVANLERETPVTEQLEVDNDVGQGNVASSPKTVPTIPDESASKPSPHPPSGMTAQSGNGANVQPNRFRRVNLYERGRWTIRDSVTEEHAEGLQPRQQQQQSLPNEGLDSRYSSLQITNHQDSSESSNGTPPLKSTQRSDSAMGSLDPPQFHVGMELTTLSGITGGGLGPESSSDKDSSSIHMDRSSTAAETLSRNTSMSSIVAPELKSMDGDEVLRDIDTDSITGNQAPSQDQDMSDIPPISPHPPVVPTSSSGAVPPPSSTALPPREDQQGTPSTGSTPALE